MLTVIVTFASANCRRYTTRVMSTHVTLAEVMDWARLQCTDEEVVAEIAFSADMTLDDRMQVRLAKTPEPNPLSRRLFH